jgi:hypothetical protein
VRSLAANGLDAWGQLVERGYEGLVAKDKESKYVGGRTRAWLKVKVPGRPDTDFGSSRSQNPTSPSRQPPGSAAGP